MGGGASLINGRIDTPKTNYDLVREMSIYEMSTIAEWLNDCNKCPANEECYLFNNCKDCFANWLRKEVKI